MLGWFLRPCIMALSRRGNTRGFVSCSAWCKSSQGLGLHVVQVYLKEKGDSNEFKELSQRKEIKLNSIFGADFKGEEFKNELKKQRTTNYGIAVSIKRLPRVRIPLERLHTTRTEALKNWLSVGDPAENPAEENLVLRVQAHEGKGILGKVRQKRLVDVLVDRKGVGEEKLAANDVDGNAVIRNLNGICTLQATMDIDFHCLKAHQWVHNKVLFYLVVHCMISQLL